MTVYVAPTDSDPTDYLRTIGLASESTPLRTVISRPGALSELSSVLAGLRCTGTAVVLHDEAKISVGTRDIVGEVTTAVRLQLDPRDLKPNMIHDTVVLDEDTVARAIVASGACSAIVAVGGGTIADLGKVLASAHNVPLVIVQTSASVNGFSDPLSVLVRAGAKSTVSSAWPVALIIDHDVVEQAPFDLTRAGYGDAAAIWCAPADWYLACALGMDSDYAPEVLRTVGAVAGPLQRVRSYQELDLSALVDTLTFGGLGIGLAGTTAVVSGCEHLISHLIDMTAMASGRNHDRHGAQVGVATVVSAVMWEKAIELFDAMQIDVERAMEPIAGLSALVERAWRRTDPSGLVGEGCARNVDAKMLRWLGRADQLREFLRDWPRHRTELTALLRPAADIAADLAAIGAPVTFSQLSPAVDEPAVRWILETLPLMRDRFTLCDLLLVSGNWTTDFIDDVLGRAAHAGGGV